jgi:DNA-binding LacI/PurR family transcriptional regulator
MSAYSIPSLTTVRQPKSELGMEAVRVCVEALTAGLAEDRLLQGELVVRGSTAPIN